MLNSIKLTNFRRHRELQVDFGAGLTVIRALNEQGKSTLLEAVSYALFGVKALRDSLDKCVTWGEPDRSLKVELDVTVDGVTYKVTRSKVGAQIDYEGGTVTGQNEVSSFVARLFKVDAGAAARLTMSNQNEIRGALEAGPKATTELIERLAEFSQLDDLIETMQEQLVLGAPTAIEANLANAKETLERAEAVLAGSNGAQLTDFERSIERLKDVEAQSRIARDSAGQLATQAGANLTSARQGERTRATLLEAMHRASANVESRHEDLRRHTVLPAPKDYGVRLETLQALAQSQREAIRRNNGLQRSYDAVAHALSAPAESVEGSVPELQNRLDHLIAADRQAELEISTLNGDIRLQEAALLHGSCSFCGKDFSDVPEVATRNAKTAQKLAAAKLELTRLQGLRTAFYAESTVLKPLLRQCESVLSLHAAYPEVTAVVGGRLPIHLKWTAEDPSVPLPDPRTAEAEIEDLKSAQRDHEVTKQRLADMQATLARDEAALKAAEAALAAHPASAVDMAQVEAEDQAARDALEAARQAHRDAERALDREELAYAEAKRAIERAAADVEGAKENITRFEKQLKTLEFNNALLKRVRQVRPLISDKLWNVVLSAVSSYFSEIRGVPSTVTKVADGFEVDGHSITSLSGSTLDALGLAIRVALVRTFLPTAPFLILDEPAAAMDDGRTENMLGFLSRCGFGQILMCSHEDVSESVADHIITL